MFFLGKPSEERIRQVFSAQQEQVWTYLEVGASRDGAPPGFTTDHNRIRLGEGHDVFSRAVESLRAWKMIPGGWVDPCWPDTPIQVGAVVGILAAHFGCWSLNVCRIVYLLEEDGPIQKFGFAYGTLPEHAECGEERFSVEWHRRDNSVWYDLFAFSRPHHILAKLGYPLTRMLQKRFAQDSKQAMLNAVCQ